MRGFLNFIIMAIIFILSIIFAASYVAPQFGIVSNTGSNANINTGVPQQPPAQPSAPPLLVVDSIKFCQTLDPDVCTTHSTSFTNVNRVYVTVDYGQAQTGKVVSFMWYKKLGGVEQLVSGDGEGITEASGLLTASLGQTTEGMPLTAGTYIFRVLDENGNSLNPSSSTGAEFVVN